MPTDLRGRASATICRSVPAGRLAQNSHAMLRTILTVCAVAAIGLPLAAQHQPSSHPAATAPRGVTAIDVYPNGDRLELLIADDRAGGYVLQHLFSTDGGATWSAPRPIEPSRGRLVRPGRNMDPQIVAAGAQLVAIWTGPGTVSRWGGGNLATAISRDGGATWSPGPVPNDDTSGRDHAFIDALADGRGAFHLVWLDPRDGRQGLRYARSLDGGASWQANISIDDTTCECCWNTLALGWEGTPLVLYRDIPRDMAMARSEDGGRTWQRTGEVGDFNWDIQACPDVGGGVTRGREAGELFSIVFTGAEEHRGVYTLRSTDNGRTWQAPLRVGSDRAWHADIAYADGVLYARRGTSTRRAAASTGRRAPTAAAAGATAG